MQSAASEANSFFAIQEVNRNLWHPTVHAVITQQSADLPCEFSPHPATPFRFTIILHVRLVLQSCLFPFGFPTKPLRALHLSPPITLPIISSSLIWTP
jgi:hypothetical protein